MGELNLVFGGDVMLVGEPQKRLMAGQGIYSPELMSVLSDADLLFANLELPFSDNCSGVSSGPIHHAPEILGERLTDLRLDIVSLANNHMLDCGREGLETTIRILESQGIKYVGAGFTEQQARRPAVIERNGLTIGFLAYAKMDSVSVKKHGYGIAKLDLGDVLADVAALRPRVDVVVVSLHWGVVFIPHPSPADVGLAKRLVEAGVDVVVGHHPHVFQKIEEYGRGVVAYSLGNFISDLKFCVQDCRPTKYEYPALLLKVTLGTFRGRAVIPLTQWADGSLGMAAPKVAEDIHATLDHLRKVDVNAEFYGTSMQSAFSVEIGRIFRLFLSGQFSQLFRKLSTIKLKHFGYLIRLAKAKLFG